VQVTPPASVTPKNSVAASPAAGPSRKRKRADSESDKENQSSPCRSTKRKRTNDKVIVRMKNLLKLVELAVQVLKQELEGSESD
jgi:hypothetical protein